MRRAEERVDRDLLRSRPLDVIDGPSTKRQRGTALVIGGSRETPGSVLLAGVAALRVGAGKLQMATVASAAPALAIAVPESRVIPLRETQSGAIAPDAMSELGETISRADAVLIGPGMIESEPAGEVLRSVVEHLGPEARLVVDAGALPMLRDRPETIADVAPRTAVIPNPVEMARLLGVTEASVRDRPEEALDAAVACLGCVVALRDASTYVAAPCTARFLDTSGHLALGTSGSGDVLAGALLGLAARSADPLRATLWAVHAHGLAGERLGDDGPGIGTLAREIAAQLPVVLRELDAGG